MRRPSNLKSDKESLYFIFIFICSIFVHLCVSLQGWYNPLLDLHHFRQTQTAITSYYIIEEGFKLKYITPVFGYPWSIPLELPLFQWIVSVFVIIFKTPLDQTGRFISLTFFYLSLIPLFLILKSLFNKNNYVYIFISLVLINPTYLYWSRAFLIESLALFLGISFGWLVMKLIQSVKLYFLFLASLFGCLAGLVKITTFVVICGPVALYFLYSFFNENAEQKPNKIKRYLLYFIFIFCLPITVNFYWVQFADIQKNMNPLASGFITSKALMDWNFGTLAQKISVSTWSDIFYNSFSAMGSFFGFFYILSVLLLIFIFIFLCKSYRKEMSYTVFFYLIGPVIFTNLYAVHSYYCYANNFFLSILFGLIIISFFENIKYKKIGIYFYPFILIYMFFVYIDAYYNYQKSNTNYEIINVAEAIKKNTKSRDVLLIYGQDWDSSLPYYAQRKAVMDRQNLPLSDSRMITVIKNNNIQAMVISGFYDPDFICDRIKLLDLNQKPIFVFGNTRIYTRKVL